MLFALFAVDALVVQLAAEIAVVVVVLAPDVKAQTTAPDLLGNAVAVAFAAVVVVGFVAVAAVVEGMRQWKSTPAEAVIDTVWGAAFDTTVGFAYATDFAPVATTASAPAPPIAAVTASAPLVGADVFAIAIVDLAFLSQFSTASAFVIAAAAVEKKHLAELRVVAVVFFVVACYDIPVVVKLKRTSRIALLYYSNHRCFDGSERSCCQEWECCFDFERKDLSLRRRVGLKDSRMRKGQRKLRAHGAIRGCLRSSGARRKSAGSRCATQSSTQTMAFYRQGRSVLLRRCHRCASCSCTAHG